MWLFILALVFLAIAVGALVVVRINKNKTGSDPEDARFIGKWATGVFAAGFILALFFSSFTTVGTKNVGVITTFGRPDGYLQNGAHFIAPWQHVTELNDAVQTDTYASNGGASGKVQEGAVASCVNVRIARQGTACVNVSIRWQIKPTGVDYLFRNYKDNAAITDNLVLRDLQTSMNQAFVKYDPLGIDTNGLSTNPLLSAPNGESSISQTVQDQMTSLIGTWIDVKNVNIPLLNFDGATQDKINQLQQQVAATRVAQQALQTATAQAAANQALAASVGNDPNVLTDKCLNILKEAVDKGQALPAGFSCFSGSTASIAVAAK